MVHKATLSTTGMLAMIVVHSYWVLFWVSLKSCLVVSLASLVLYLVAFGLVVTVGALVVVICSPPQAAKMVKLLWPEGPKL